LLTYRFLQSYDQACDCWEKFRKLRHTRDKAFHLFLPGSGGNSVVQKWIEGGACDIVVNGSSFNNYYRGKYLMSVTSLILTEVRAAMKVPTKRRVAYHFSISKQSCFKWEWTNNHDATVVFLVNEPEFDISTYVCNLTQSVSSISWSVVSCGPVTHHRCIGSAFVYCV
jgi:hypothetical protein